MTRVTWLGYAVYLLLGWTSALVPALVVDIEGSSGRTDAAIELLFVIGTAISRSGGGGADGGVGAIFLDAFPDGRGGALNRLHLLYGIGALLGSAAVGVIVMLDLGWRPLFVGTDGVALALAGAARTLPRGNAAGVRGVDEPSAGPVSTRERSLVPFVWLAISIACYEAAALGVVSWLVRFLSDEPGRVATGALSLFWAGICLVRLAGPWLTRRFPPVGFTVGCIVGASAALTVAVLVPWTPLAIGLFAVTGL